MDFCQIRFLKISIRMSNQGCKGSTKELFAFQNFWNLDSGMENRVYSTENQIKKIRPITYLISLGFYPLVSINVRKMQCSAVKK